MSTYKKLSTITGWVVFAISFLVFLFSAERTGSLWDCGEFILGAYKLQVVHPPGAPLFLLIGSMFTWIADILSSNPANIAFSVNILSGICAALMATFVAWTTIIFGHLTFDEKAEDLSPSQIYILCGAGLAAGLASAFSSSIWFSAVEGEVYAMSTMFTAMTFWAVTKWYHLENKPQNDKWLMFAVYSAGLSLGVHLLSLLTYPAIALLIYFKKYKTHNLKGILLSLFIGVILIVYVQKVIIVGIPILWKNFEYFTVNSLGMPFHSGLIPTFALLAALIFFLLRYAHQKGKYVLQLFVVGSVLTMIGFSTIGVVVIRANADTPINMNVPSDAMRLIPYLNREQYGERALLFGPHFDANPIEVKKESRYGRVGDRYEIVDEKYEYVYGAEDKMLFPRIGHNDPGRKSLYRQWWGQETGTPKMGFNLSFFVRYQVNWMYWRYFMWNFVGKQNAHQGYFPWDKSKGNWASGIPFIDEMKLFKMDSMPQSMKNHKGTNNYFFLPLIFGLMGLFYHSSKKPKDFLSLLTLFLITGIGIVIYSNQPPNEPRERDYVLAGSFFTFCIWIGLGSLFLFNWLKEKWKASPTILAVACSIVVLSAPIIMGFQNFDDHSRRHHFASRDYTSNFLESCEPNSIIFTYGDNDTYPLWYAQEVEGIRTDVRVVNLSLIAVDWYINKLRSKVNNSPGLNLTIPSEAYRGKKRNQVFYYNPNGLENPLDLNSELRYIGNPNNEVQGQTIMRSRKLFIPINKERAIQSGLVSLKDSANIVPRIDITLPQSPAYITKDELAVLDVIASNIWERPIYFATTCKNEKLLGLNDFTQLEGLGLRIIPVKTPSDAALSIYGSGRTDADKIYRNVMERFKWGNFDKKELFVDNSYAAEVQSHRMIMMRAAETLSLSGEHEKAVQMSDKFFASFPHFNFPYTPYVMPFINVYAQNNEMDKAKEHMRILANELSEYMQFFDSIGTDVVQSSFEFEYMYNLRGVRDILDLAKKMGDVEFDKEMVDLLGPYDLRNINN